MKIAGIGLERYRRETKISGNIQSMKPSNCKAIFKNCFFLFLYSTNTLTYTFFPPAIFGVAPENTSGLYKIKFKKR